jgi:hypothetical protein
MEKLDAFLDETIKGIYTNSTDKDVRYIGLESLKLRLTDALNGNGILASEVTDSKSELSKLINSPAGQSLLDSAKVAIGLSTDADSPFGQLPDSLQFTLKSIYYSAEAATRVKEEIKVATSLSDFLSETNARMSLKMGAEAVSFDVSNIDSQMLGTKMYDLSSEVIFANNANKERLLPTLEKLGIGFEDFQAQVEKFKDIHGTDLQGYKEAIRALGYTDKSEFEIISKVQEELIKESSKSTFLESIQNKVRNLTDLQAMSVNRTDFSKEIEMGQRIIEDLNKIQTDYSTPNLPNPPTPGTPASAPPATPPTVPTSAPSTAPPAVPPNVPPAAPPATPPDPPLPAPPPTNLRDKKSVIKDVTGVLTSYTKTEEDAETFNSLMKDRYLKPANLSELSEIDIQSINSELFDETSGVQSTLNQMLQQDSDGVTMEHIIYDVAQHTSGIEGGTHERAIGARARISNIIEQHKQGNSLLKILGGNATKEMQAAATKAASVANQQNAATGGLAGAARTLGTEGPQGVLSSASKMFSKVQVPLLALGGIVGLLAAKQPNLGDTFSQGNASKSLGTSFSGDENVVAKFSEIPGSPESQQVWYGGTMPFQIDMTFTGFVGDRMQHQKLQREVYNILNSNMEVRKASGEIQDSRNRQHRLAAVEAMRGQI